MHNMLSCMQTLLTLRMQQNAARHTWQRRQITVNFSTHVQLKFYAAALLELEQPR